METVSDALLERLIEVAGEVVVSVELDRADLLSVRFDWINHTADLARCTAAVRALVGRWGFEEEYSEQEIEGFSVAYGRAGAWSKLVAITTAEQLLSEDRGEWQEGA